MYIPRTLLEAGQSLPVHRLSTIAILGRVSVTSIISYSLCAQDLANCLGLDFVAEVIPFFLGPKFRGLVATTFARQ